MCPEFIEVLFAVDNLEMVLIGCQPTYSNHPTTDINLHQMPASIQIALRMPPSLKKTLEKKAAADRRSLSNLIVKVLTDWAEVSK